MSSDMFKRNRKKTSRRWTVEEILRIIEFLKEDTGFEKPTAQIYYKKFLEKGYIDTTWDLVRWKVRYLRITFKKAQEWLKSPEAKLLESQDGSQAIKEKLRKLCPYYHYLKDLFGGKFGSKRDLSLTVFDTFDSETKSSFLISNINEPEHSQGGDDSIVNVMSPVSVKNERMSPEVITIDGEDERDWDEFEEQKHSFEQPTEQIKTEKTELQRIKIEFETTKLNKEMEIYERKLKLKEMKIVEQIERRKEEMDIRNQELDLKRLEIEKDERLRRLEIEKQERVEKYEIEMRYKYAK